MKSRDAAGNTAVSGDLTFTTSAPSGGGGSDDDSRIKTDYNIYPEPRPPVLPAAGGTFVDPTFGTTIMRVTDERDGAFNVTNYSYYPSFNRDNSRLFIVSGGQPTLYSFDPTGFRVSAKRPLFTGSLPGGGHPWSEDAIWSGIDRDVLYCHAGLKLYSYNVVTNAFTLIKDFTGQVAGTELMQMSKSIDDNAFGFHCRTSAGVVGYIAYRRSQDSIYRADTSDVNEVQVDKTGSYLVVSTETAGFQSAIEVKIVNLSTRAVVNLTDGGPDFAPGHKDVGRGIVIGGDNWNNAFNFRRLDTPHQHYRVVEMGNDWTIGSHVSLLADDEGWLMVSTYYISNGLPSSGLFKNELFQVATDGSRRVRRLAHLHSTLREYWDSPRATISRDGRYAVFTSNWGATNRRDVFIVRIPPPGGGGGGGGGDTTAPTITSISASGVSSTGATVAWATNEASDTQVEYGTTTGYGSATTRNATMVTAHSATLSGLAASTLYHYRVKSRDAAGNTAVSGDLTFTTAATGGGGGGSSPSSVVWTQMINAVANGASLQKTSGYGDTADAGGRSQQAITSGSGYMEFTTPATNKTFFCGLALNASGTDYQGIDYSLKITDSSVAEVRENNAYKAEISYAAGDVFRIAVEGGAVKYYKNGAVFYTSAKALSYPLAAKASLISVGAQVLNAAIAALAGGTVASVFETNDVYATGAGPGGVMAYGLREIGLRRELWERRRFRLLI